MGQVIEIGRSRRRTRRVSLLLHDPLLSEVERDAKRLGLSVQDYARLSLSFMLEMRAQRGAVRRTDRTS